MARVAEIMKIDYRELTVVDRIDQALAQALENEQAIDLNRHHAGNPLELAMPSSGSVIQQMKCGFDYGGDHNGSSSE